MKIKFIIILFAVFLYSCEGKKPTGILVKMLFEHPFTVTPNNDTIHLGDTLYINADFSDTLFEYYSQQLYHLHNYNYEAPFFAIFKIIDKNLNEQERAINKFDTINYGGNIDYFVNNLYVHYHLNYDELKHRYTFNIALIPKEKGMFYLDFVNNEYDEKKQDLRPYINLGYDENGLPKGGWYMGSLGNCNKGNNHFDLLYNNTHITAPLSDTIISNVLFVPTKSTYTFVVQ